MPSPAIWSRSKPSAGTSTHWALARWMPRLYASIADGDLAAGIMKAGVAISLGLLNAASMTP